MSLLWIIIRREWLLLIRSAAGLVPVILLLAGFGWRFVYLLHKYDGSFETIPVVWSLAAAPFLPLLAALVSMRGFTADRETGMLRLMFSSPIRARTWVLGKMFAALLVAFVYLILTLFSVWILLTFFLPDGAIFSSPYRFWLTGFAILFLQAFLWSSVGTFISICSKRPQVTAVLTVLVCCVLPIAIFMGLRLISPLFDSQWTWLPLLSHVYDFSSGLISSSQIIGYLSISLFFIYAAGIFLDIIRNMGTER